MRIKKSALLGLSTLVSVLLLKILSLAVVAQTIVGEIPDVLRECIPAQAARLRIAQAELVSQTQFESKDYYLFKLKSDATPPITYDHVIASDSQDCQVVYSNPMGDDLPLSNILDRPVADQLRLGHFRRILEQIGRSAFAERIKKADFTTLDPEEVWALQQLGFNSQ